MASHTLRGITAFIATSYTLAYLIDQAAIPSLKQGEQLTALTLLALRMLTPTIGALAALAVEGRLTSIRAALTSLGLRDPGPRWILLGGLLSLAGLSTSMLVSPLLGLELRLCGSASLIPAPLLLMIAVLGFLAGITVNLAVALGEELGWRGYLHGAIMERARSIIATGLLVGLAWGLWHAPLIAAGYNYGLGMDPGCGPGSAGVIPVLVFTLLTMALGVPMAWLRERAGSTVPSAAMHGVLNALGGMTGSAVVGPRLLAPPAGVAGIVGFGLVALAVVLLGRKG